MKKYSTGLRVLRTILVLSVIALPLIGSDCNNVTTQNSGTIAGTWELNFVQGNLQDICIGEKVVFPSNTSGTATLTCPGQPSVTAEYTFSNNELSYNNGAGPNYSVNSTSPSLLILTGTFTSGNVTSTRILTYKHPATGDERGVQYPVNQGLRNSSQKQSAN